MKNKSISKKILATLLISSMLLPGVMASAVPTENTLYNNNKSILENGKINIILNELYKTGDTLTIDCYILNDTSKSISKMENLTLVLADKNNKKFVNAQFDTLEFKSPLAPGSLVRYTLNLNKNLYNLDGVDLSTIHISWTSNTK